MQHSLIWICFSAIFWLGTRLMSTVISGSQSSWKLFQIIQDCCAWNGGWCWDTSHCGLNWPEEWWKHLQLQSVPITHPDYIPCYATSMPRIGVSGWARDYMQMSTLTTSAGNPSMNSVVESSLNWSPHFQKQGGLSPSPRPPPPPPPPQKNIYITGWMVILDSS